MSYNPNASLNDLIRQRGNRSRSLPGPGSAQTLPNIGQTPAVQAANMVLPQQPTPQPQMQQAPPLQATPQMFQQTPPPVSVTVNGPLAAPTPVQGMTMHGPGQQADANHYNYEPQSDGSWKVYPPGVNAPPGTQQASMPRAASTADYRRMRQAFQMQTQTPPNPSASAAPIGPLPY